VHVGGEEGTERRQLADRVSVSPWTRRSVYSTAAMRCEGASGAAVDGAPTMRSINAPGSMPITVVDSPNDAG
jgi:hypothetical protein